MAISEIDSETLINRFCGPLAPSDRGDFRRAAAAAIERLPCAGEGAVYRVLREIFRQYFHPPPDEIAKSGPRHRGGKLVDLPAIGADTESGLKSAATRWARG